MKAEGAELKIWDKRVKFQASFDNVNNLRKLPEEGQMSTLKIIVIVLIIAGTLGLLYGQFSYTKETHDAKLGPLELRVKEKEIVNIPGWAGVGAIAIGVILLLRDKR